MSSLPFSPFSVYISPYTIQEHHISFIPFTTPTLCSILIGSVLSIWMTTFCRAFYVLCSLPSLT